VSDLNRIQNSDALYVSLERRVEESGSNIEGVERLIRVRNRNLSLSCADRKVVGILSPTVETERLSFLLGLRTRVCCWSQSGQLDMLFWAQSSAEPESKETLSNGIGRIIQRDGASNAPARVYGWAKPL
jgi:hypothetical protein